LEIYEKFTGDDPREVPMKIFPAVHYTMGGLYTTYAPYDPETDTITPASSPKREPNQGMAFGDPQNMMTNLPGLYAFGEANYAYHGATRLGANALLSCIFDGLFNGLSVANHAKASAAGEHGTPAASTGAHDPYTIHRELGVEMTAAATVVKEEGRMLQAREKLAELREQYKDLKISDTGHYSNQNVSFARALGDMLVYADALLEASLARKESRGSHYRSDYPERMDEAFHNTSRVSFNTGSGRPDIQWEPIPSPLVPLRARTYGKTDTKDDKTAAAAK